MSVRKAATARHATPGIEAFEKAVKAFGKKEYDKAREIFEDIVKSHGDERDLADRCRSYLLMCERAEKRSGPKPKTFEELLHHGIFLHNQGLYDDALKAFEHAAEIHPRSEHVLYCIAACQARRGDEAASVKALQSAIKADPANRAQARLDEDFDGLRDSDAFLDAMSPVEE